MGEDVEYPEVKCDRCGTVIPEGEDKSDCYKFHICANCLYQLWHWR